MKILQKKNQNNLSNAKVQVDDLREPTNVIRTNVHRSRSLQNLEKIPRIEAVEIHDSKKGYTRRKL